MTDEEAAIRGLGHRAFVGGRWEEIGRLQLQFLVDQGLRPHHYFLDVGCGALRGGVHFITYLSRGRYLGIDKHAELVEAGLERELGAGRRAERMPEVVVSDSFEFERLSKRPHYALAHSLFTHLDEADIRRCLRQLRDFARPGCRFFATYFEATEAVDNPSASASTLRFDYPAERLVELAESERWQATRLGDWGHPRGQLMMLFEPQPAPTARRRPRTPVRDVSVALPVRNGGPTFVRVLEALRKQTGVRVAEIIVIDSGSSDGTMDVARRAGARVVEIPPAEFNHGATRDRLMELADCETVLLTVADAVLAGADSLETLVAELEADPSLAAVSARQCPGPDAELYSAFEVWAHNEVTVAPRSTNWDDDSAGPIVDNVCVAMRRSAWEEVRFRECDFGEDADFAARAAAAGWRTIVSADAVVEHHHNRDAGYVLGRAAVHRLELAGTIDDGPIRELGAGPVAFSAGARALLREVATAAEWAVAGADRVPLRAFVERLHGLVSAGVPMTDPGGELALADAVLGDAPVGDPRGGAAARAQVVEILDWPLLRTYAGQFAEPVDGDEARKFAARLAALKVGRALGEALRHEPDPALLVRVRAAFSAPHSGDGSPARARASGRGTGGRAIAVVGMHRSGTSLVARLLNLIGVPFGRQETMLPPQPDNPTGYWEQRAVMELNDELLAVLGSAWDDPAGLPRGWEAAPELAPFAERARRLVEEHYGDLPEWGFKDPRLSILLPFWLRVVPDLSFVVCVRNPVDVTHSLERREGSMGGTAADLWLHYTAAALRHTSGRPRLVVAYEDFYMRPREAVERLARFAGHELAELDPDVRARIDEFIQADLWHHRSSLADVLCDPATPAEAQTLYRWLHDGDGSPTAPPGLLDGLAEGLADSRRERARLQGQAEPLREEVRDLTARLAASDTELAGVRARLADVEQELELHKAWLDGIQRSASWQITAPLRRAKSLARRGASD